MKGMTRAGITYLSLTLTAAASVLGATLWLYIAYAKGVPDTFSAAVVNTAATLAAATFVGVFDMFFTIQQMRQNEENQRQWREELQKERAEAQAAAQQERAAAQQERAAANARLERLLEDARIEREQNQQVIADLLARNLELNARLLELLERRNGNGSAQSF